MYDVLGHTLGEPRHADDLAPIVEQLDQIALCDTPLGRDLRMDPRHPVRVPVFLYHPMLGDLPQPGAVLVVVRVIGIARMRRDELQREPREIGRKVAFPTVLVPRHRRPLVVLGRELLEAFGHELDLAAQRAEAVVPLRVVFVRIVIGGVARPVFVEPAQRRSRFVVVGHGDRVVAAFLELLVGHHRRHV